MEYPDTDMLQWGYEFDNMFPDLFARMVKDLYVKPVLKIFYGTLKRAWDWNYKPPEVPLYASNFMRSRLK